ncbi:hypothetical protein VZT92_025213 [Zoarces viviparus]|uniref:Shelterin complex subunit TPP1/Est3 domain-containing protein n=1 Tax=Zoarces viviparus TaxID=48416 RepID=A0AAW1E4D5_ZOAVI
MPGAAPRRLPPWIERLILSYGSQEERGSGQLKAHVIGVGHMSQSQALVSEGPTGLLFLSDGLLQIPTILTASAWERLQEQEDRECFTSLVNATVCIRDYRLQFHMAQEQTRSRFVLSVGELATTSAGPVKAGTPCSTTLPSIRMKICQTWTALQGQETQDSQCGFDLSELLGEWQNDVLQAVLQDVGEKLAAASPQPSTSTRHPSATHTDTFAATSWSVDRVRYKGVKGFSVPMKCLLIAEEDAQQMQTPPIVGSRTASGLPEDRERDSPPPSETTPPSVDHAGVVESDQGADQTSPCPVEDSMQQEDAVSLIDVDSQLLSNYWDKFPPPSVTSSCDASLTLSPSLHHPAAPDCRSDPSGISTSTQLPVHSAKESQQTLECSNLPPYQRLQHSAATAASSTSVSPPEPFSRPSDPLPASDQRRTGTDQATLPAVDRESQILEKDAEEAVGRKSRKRRRSEPAAEAPINGSAPSWLFDTQAGSGADEGGSQAQPAGPVSRKTPTVHSDGRRFSYSYQLSGQNLQDLSGFSVAEAVVRWAVGYLVVPKQTEDPVTCDRTLFHVEDAEG